jgi:hypothetical protein
MEIARITSFGLSGTGPLGVSAGRPAPATTPAPGTASRPTIDLTEGDGRADRADPSVLAWERSLVDLRRQTTASRREENPAGAFAEPALREAAATLGLRGRLSQDEVDRRFREIVKAERPDLGAMSGERLDAVRAARTALTTHLRRARWIAPGAAPPPGTLADVAA